MVAGCALPQEFRVNGIQPGNAVLVVQWNAAMHLGFVPRRVKIVGFQKHPAQTRSERSRDGGFARACHSHYQKDHRGSEKGGGRAEFGASHGSKSSASRGNVSVQSRIISAASAGARDGVRNESGPDKNSGEKGRPFLFRV